MLDDFNGQTSFGLEATSTLLLTRSFESQKTKSLLLLVHIRTLTIHMHRKITESICSLIEGDLMISATLVGHLRRHCMTYQNPPSRNVYYSTMLSAASYHSHCPIICRYRILLLTTPRNPATDYSVAHFVKIGARPCTKPWLGDFAPKDILQAVSSLISLYTYSGKSLELSYWICPDSF